MNVKKNKTKQVVITLDKEEARVLCGALGAISGNPKGCVRKVTDKLYNKILENVFNGNYKKVKQPSIVRSMETIPLTMSEEEEEEEEEDVEEEDVEEVEEEEN